MSAAFSEEQETLRSNVRRICERFGDDYWLQKDRDGGFPHDFHRAFAEAGWLGIAMPEEYGGAGLGITEAALMMQSVAESGAGFSGASALHMNIFGLQPVVVCARRGVVAVELLQQIDLRALQVAALVAVQVLHRGLLARHAGVAERGCDTHAAGDEDQQNDGNESAQHVQ